MTKSDEQIIENSRTMHLALQIMANDYSRLRQLAADKNFELGDIYLLYTEQNKFRLYMTSPNKVFHSHYSNENYHFTCYSNDFDEIYNDAVNAIKSAEFIPHEKDYAPWFDMRVYDQGA
jgi:hypothetical protein